MKSYMHIIGLILIIFGITVLAYHGFTYKSEKKVAEIGNLKITPSEMREVSLSPLLGGIAFFTGILVLVTRRPARK